MVRLGWFNSKIAVLNHTSMAVMLPDRVRFTNIAVIMTVNLRNGIKYGNSVAVPGKNY